MSYQFNVEDALAMTKFLSLLKSKGEQYISLLRDGFESYLESQFEKYYVTSTFLHRSGDKLFRKVYFPVSVSKEKFSTNFYSVEEVLDKYNFVTISGSAGTGKSTLLKHVFLRLIETTDRIPVMIELRHLNTSKDSIEGLIINKLNASKNTMTRKKLQRYFDNGKFVFLLDGFDELFSENVRQIINDIETFVDINYRNSFIITTRPGTPAQNLPRFVNFSVDPLSTSDIKSFVNLVVENKERIQQLETVIFGKENVQYLHFLNNPLLLSMFILSFESFPEIPKKRSVFYRNVFDTLYSKHDGWTKNSYIRERKSGLQQEEFELILERFSFVSLIRTKYSWEIEELKDEFVNSMNHVGVLCPVSDLLDDILISISLIVLDGLEYKFPHRSMQEYFAARYISRVPDIKKEAVYEKMIEIFEDRSRDGRLVFPLCMELDEFSFNELVLLPFLTELVKNTEGLTDIQLAKYLFDQYEVGIMAVDSGRKNRNDTGFLRPDYLGVSMNKGARFELLTSLVSESIQDVIVNHVIERLHAVRNLPEETLSSLKAVPNSDLRLDYLITGNIPLEEIFITSKLCEVLRSCSNLFVIKLSQIKSKRDRLDRMLEEF